MGLEKGYPIKASDSDESSNGALFLSAMLDKEKQQIEKIFVYKRDHLLEGAEMGISGGAKREQLAYLLDENHVAGVPPTFYVNLSGAKDKRLHGIGSLQYYEYPPPDSVRYYDDPPSMSSVHVRYKPYFAPEPLSHQGVVDLRLIYLHNLRLLNLDSPQTVLGEEGRSVPIDHGYTLPSQLTTKFHAGPKVDNSAFSEEERSYIERLSLEQHAKLLREHGISEEAIALQQGVLQMMKTALKIQAVTLQHLLRLFYGGRRYGGGYEQCVRIGFRPELKEILSAKNEKERLEAIQTSLTPGV